MEAVSSQPKLPGFLVCVRSLLKCSSQPGSLWWGKGFSSTPKYTSPSGPTVGGAEEPSKSIASMPDDGSVRRTRPTGASVVLLRAGRDPKFWIATATYKRLPSGERAGAQLMATCVIRGSPLATAAETQVPVPSGAMRARPLCRLIGVGPDTMNP